MKTVTSATSSGSELAFHALGIMLDNQGAERTKPDGSLYSVRTIDFDGYRKLREVSSNLRDCVDTTRSRLELVLPDMALRELDQLVDRVRDVYMQGSESDPLFEDPVVKELLYDAYAQSRWLTDESIDQLVCGECSHQKYLLRNGHLPSVQRNSLKSLLLPNMDKATKVALASDRNTPADWFSILAEDPDTEVRQAVARNSAVPQPLLLKMSRSQDIAVQECVAGNQNAPDKALIHLARHFSQRVRVGVAANTHIPSRAMRILVGDTSEQVKRALARNEFVEPDILAILANTNSQMIKALVAVHVHTPADTLIDLAQEPDWYLKYRVVQNPGAPPEALDNICQAFMELLEHDLLPVTTVFFNAVFETVLMVMENPNTSDLSLMNLFQADVNAWQDWEGRRDLALAKNFNAPDRILFGLVTTSRSEQVLYALLNNSALSDEMKRNSADVYELLSRLLARGREDELSDLVLDYDIPKDVDQRIPGLYEVLLNLESSEVKVKLAQDPDTPAWVLERLADEESWQIRWSLVENPKLTNVAFEKLVLIISEGSFELAGELQFAYRLVEHPKMSVETLAGWSLQSIELDKRITAHRGFQKVAARLIELDVNRVEIAGEAPPSKRLRVG